jgi:hypothetical protein
MRQILQHLVKYMQFNKPRRQIQETNARTHTHAPINQPAHQSNAHARRLDALDRHAPRARHAGGPQIVQQLEPQRRRRAGRGAEVGHGVELVLGLVAVLEPRLLADLDLIFLLCEFGFVFVFRVRVFFC